jgi:hypothetical protein
MARQTNSAKFWRSRAEEVLALADQMTDPECRRLLLTVAYTYTQLARHAEERERRNAR